MAAMPNQPNLPLFDDPPTPPPAATPSPEAEAPARDLPSNPVPEDATAAHDAPELPLDAPPTAVRRRRLRRPPPVAPRDGSSNPVGARPPLWARLMGKLLEPWIGLELEPRTPADWADGRPVCYVLEDYGLSNALILERACREAGLPSPLQPMPGDPLGRKRAYVALSRRATPIR